jgi:hypothetical protein
MNGRRINLNSRLNFGKFKGVDVTDLLLTRGTMFNKVYSYFVWIQNETDIEVTTSVVKALRNRKAELNMKL